MRPGFEPATFSSRTRSAIKRSRACAALGLALLLVGAAPAPAPGGDEPVAHTIADVAWIAGAWIGANGEHRFEEHWTIPAAGCMTGMFRWTVGDRLRVHELIVLEEEAGGVTMRLRHFGMQMRPWEESALVFRLVELEEGRAIFHQREAEAPKRLEYTFDEDADSLVVALIEMRDGEERAVRFSMRRASGRGD
ncbi:MAG: hypothetical protein EA376_07025 [Phycisphaeraceae bacterium]|nr:MAG: hypothetical protein EA376_07025 [Phycisphaeraceae bacterium]